MKRPELSKRMKENNPMKNPEIVRKMVQTRKEKGLYIGNKNPNWKGGQTKKKCYICGKEFLIYPSQQHQKTCGKKCADKSRKINSTMNNLGKTKETCDYLMKMSKERTGVPRTEELKKRLSKIVKKRIHQPDNWKKFIEGNKNRNMDFIHDISWHEKRKNTRSKNIKDGKYIYKNIRMRSNWEVKTAKYFDEQGFNWEYEPIVFYLKDIKTYYIPDFYVKELNSFVEVKGFMYGKSLEKINSFKKMNKLILYDESKVKELGIL